MTTPLFLDQGFKPTFQKIAMPVRLSESPEAWQRDIAGEIYKQLPFVGEYAVNVILDRVDAQRGYGFGSALITNKTDAPMPDQAEMATLRIPLVIRDYLMAPLDIFMDGSGVFPLTESRLREKLFRPEAMELSTRKPSDKGLADQLYPPIRSNYGMNSMTGGEMGMGKVANDAEAGRRAAIARMKGEAASNTTHIAGMKCASLIDAIASTISDKVADDFVEKIAKDDELRLLASRNDHFKKLAMKIAAAPRIGVEKTAAAIVDAIKPNVVQLEKLADGNFRVKWANSQAFNPQEGVVPPQAANEMAGQDVSGMKPGATVTLSNEKAQKQSLNEPVYVQVSQFGKYCVQDADSASVFCGWVFPIVDFEMEPLELYLFVRPDEEPGFSGSTDGSEPTQQTNPGAPGVWAAQDEIAGLPMGGGEEELFSEIHEKYAQLPPQGSGVFVSTEGKCCLLPMTIQNGAGAGFMGENMWGEQITVQKVPGLEAIEMMGEGVYGIPENLVWLPLPGQPIFLAKSPLDIETTQQAQQMPNQVQVGSTGPGEFSMEGQPLAKVATQNKRFIKTAEAEFLLVAMGVNPFDARDILKQAEAGKLVKCAGRPIVSLAHLHKEMTKQAHTHITNLPNLRQDLVKEATVIDDADTADKVLSMNFINPENISTFAKYLPELDEASKKLAELLLGIRLGIGSVDEGAVERAMKGLEAVIDGLKMMQQKASA